MKGVVDARCVVRLLAPIFFDVKDVIQWLAFIFYKKVI